MGAVKADLSGSKPSFLRCENKAIPPLLGLWPGRLLMTHQPVLKMGL
jgi:hypothetical protein